MRDTLYVAIDLKPGSGRVVLCGVEPGELLLDEVCRFRYPAHGTPDRLLWDVDRIFDEIKAGLLLTGDRARALGREIRSIGVGGWGVDYGLVDRDGHLVDGPVSHSSNDTREFVNIIYGRVPRKEIF